MVFEGSMCGGLCSLSQRSSSTGSQSAEAVAWPSTRLPCENVVDHDGGALHGPIAEVLCGLARGGAHRQVAAVAVATLVWVAFAFMYS